MFLAIRKIIVHLHMAIFSRVCLVNRSAVWDSWWLLWGSKEGLCNKNTEPPGTHGAPSDEHVLYNAKHSKDIPHSIASLYILKKAQKTFFVRFVQCQGKGTYIKQKKCTRWNDVLGI